MYSTESRQLNRAARSSPRGAYFFSPCIARANPPFVGASMMTKMQKDEAVAVFGKGKRVNSIDYVGAWYHKAAALMQNTQICAAFVSTNSITQGEQVAPLWEKLLTEYHAHIIFAYRTFKWNSEAKEKAAVHCVIIGFRSVYKELHADRETGC